MANYLTVQEADALSLLTLNVDAWDAAKVTDGSSWGVAGTLCVKALTMATSIINSLRYKGEKTDSDQVNQFPREDETTVPEDITVACFLIANVLLDGIDPELEYENTFLLAQGYANVRSTYDRETPAFHIIAGVPSIVAWRHLLPYIQNLREIKLYRV